MHTKCTPATGVPWRVCFVRMSSSASAWASLVSRGENVLQKRTYRGVQRRLRSADATETKAYVIDLHSEAVRFKRLLVPTKEDRQWSERRLGCLGGRRINGAAPAALPLIRLQDGASVEVPGRLVRDLVFLVRRLISGELTNNLNSMFGSMCQQVALGDGQAIYRDGQYGGGHKTGTRVQAGRLAGR